MQFWLGSILRELRVKDAILGVLVALVVGAGVWWYVDRSRLSDQVAAANARAEHFDLAYGLTARAWEERARQVLNQRELVDSLQERNRDLAEKLGRRGATLLSLQDINARLRAKLDSSRTTVGQTDSTTFTVDLDESVYFEGGGRFQVRGRVVVEATEPAVETNLTASGGFPITVVLAREENGDLSVHAFTGDPRLSISRLDVTNNVSDPLTSKGPGVTLGNVLSNVMSPLTWIKVAAGFGACLAIR